MLDGNEKEPFYNALRYITFSWKSIFISWVILKNFFYKITNERETKTVFTYAHVKWFYGQSECACYLNYFIIDFGNFDFV